MFNIRNTKTNSDSYLRFDVPCVILRICNTVHNPRNLKLRRYLLISKILNHQKVQLFWTKRLVVLTFFANNQNHILHWWSWTKYLYLHLLGSKLYPIDNSAVLSCIVQCVAQSWGKVGFETFVFWALGLRSPLAKSCHSHMFVGNTHRFNGKILWDKIQT